MIERDTSRRDTTHTFSPYVLSLMLDARPGSRGWVKRALQLRVAEKRGERDVAADIVKRRHYLRKWPVRPRTLVLSYLADLDGVVRRHTTGAAGLVMVALLPGQFHVARALEVHPCSVLSFVRSWRADDLGPELAPNFMAETIRRVVHGERCSRCRHHAGEHAARHCTGLGVSRSGDPLCVCPGLLCDGVADLGREWTARKCRDGGLWAVPRLLVTYADPAVGHDGSLYLAAGATACGPGAGGKLLFAWALDQDLRKPLADLGRGVVERSAA